MRHASTRLTGSRRNAPAGLDPFRDRTHRPELQGLRAVAVLLVVVYHVFVGRVSGGVDVFLFLTGFLITTSLLGTYARSDRLSLPRFLARLAARLTPPVAVVLAGILVAAVLFLPETRWRETFAHAFASMTYWENWRLASDAVDYVARDAPPSLMQHFWSLSIQGQFYLVWFALVGAALWAGVRWNRGRVLPVVVGVIAVVGAASLTYSVYMTGRDQPWAYFDTGARLWEFAVGALLAIGIARIRLPRGVRIAAGWTGLAGLVACGALMDVSALFPGWIALWPIASAALVLIAGTTGSRAGVDALLTLRPLHVLGDWSYALYLWHWPVYLVYLQVTGYEAPTWRGGVYIVATSLVLAAATTWLLDHRPLRLPRAAVGVLPRTAYAAVWVVPVVALAVVGGQVVTEREERAAVVSAELSEDHERYPGALTLIDPERYPTPDGVEPIPADPTADTPLAFVGERCMNAMTGEARIVTCPLGDQDSDVTVLAVGSSRMDHYMDGLHAAGLERGWRVYPLNRSGCQYATDAPDDECGRWNDLVEEHIPQVDPDLVVTLGSRVFEEREVFPPGFAGRWRQLEAEGIPVLALRDAPRRPKDETIACIDRVVADPARAGECVTDASAVYDVTDGLAARYPDLPGNVAFADLSEYICPEHVCRYQVGNVATHQDHSHITATYSRTLAPVLGDAVDARLRETGVDRLREAGAAAS